MYGLVLKTYKNHIYDNKYSPAGQCILSLMGFWTQNPLQQPGWGPTERA